MRASGDDDDSVIVMTTCPDHWDALQEAIRLRELEHLVCKDGSKADAALRRMLSGQATRDDFDPLLSAHWAICCAFIEVAGVEGLAHRCCPLCEAEEHESGLSTDWINGAVDDQLGYARYLGLVTPLQ